MENNNFVMEKEEKKGYSTRSENAEPSEKFDTGEMTVPEFIAYLTDTYGTNLNGKPFTFNYVHTMLATGHMPRHYGGNNLRVRKVKGIKTVKMLDTKYQFYKRDEDYEITPKTILNK